MQVVVTVNENYDYPLKVMLYSLFSTQEEPVTVFLIHTGISAASVEMLKNFSSSYGGELLEVKIEEDTFAQAPVMAHFSKEMYYRLLCPWLLSDVERVLYLDPDMIINDSLSSFFHMNLEGAALAAGRDRPAGMDNRARLKLNQNTVYVNSGVLLMDLEKMRERNKEELLFLLEEKKEELIYPDQDIINLFWEGSSKVVEDCYNLNANILFLKERLCTPFRKKVKRYAKIIHYAGKEKPWNNGYKKGMYAYWARAEWHVDPSKRFLLAGRCLLEPYRFVYGFYCLLKDHDWKRDRHGCR